MSRTTTVMVAALVAFGLLAAPAAATPPEREDLIIHNVVEDDGEACGFPVRWDINIEARLTNFFDRDGNLVREQLFIREHNTVENLDSGLVLQEGPDTFMQTTTFEPDGTRIITSTGLSVFISAGRDSVIDAGRFVLIIAPDGTVLVLHSAGQHEPRQLAADAGIDLGAILAAFCDVLE